MRLVSFPGGFGRVQGDEIVPMGADLVGYLAGHAQPSDGAPVPMTDCELLAPVPRPGKIICIGLNYRDHADEVGKALPERPVIFGKFANSVVADDADVEIPAVVQQADWEAELGLVIGRTASRTPVDQALAHVAGYTCINDLSARDLQRAAGQWTWGKAIDGFLPMGPVLVTPDEIEDPQRLAISCRLNGETVQESNTAQMVFGVAELVSFVSQTITLEPGDVIATGTPGGIGASKTPARFLRPGDRLTVEIENIGQLHTRMVGGQVEKSHALTA